MGPPCFWANGRAPQPLTRASNIHNYITYIIGRQIFEGDTDLCYTLELIQTLYAQHGKENWEDFYNSVFSGEAKMCLGLMSFRAPSPAPSTEKLS